MQKLIVVWLLALPLWAAADNSNWSDSGIRGPKYEVLLRKLRHVTNHYPSLAQMIQYGVTPQGRPMTLLVVGRKNVTGPRPAVIMSGSTHGNEYLNIEDRLPGEILKRAHRTGPVADFIDRGGVFIFVPILNPDGFAARTRENAHGVDLNRDWTVRAAETKGFKEVETRLLAQRIESLRKQMDLQVKVTVDYHCCAGAVLHAWSYRGAPAVDDQENQRHRDFGVLATQHLGVEVGTTPQLLGYSAVGTTKDYYYEKYNAVAFTYEGRFHNEDKNLDKHVLWWEDMLRLIVRGENKPLLARRPPPLSSRKVALGD